MSTRSSRPSAASRPPPSTRVRSESTVTVEDRPVLIEPVVTARRDDFLPRAKDTDARPVVFLDRDGVINATDVFINTPETVDGMLLPAALEAIATLTRLGVDVIIVTNQAGIQQGKMTEETSVAINARVAQRIQETGGAVRAIFYCPTSGTPDLAVDEVDARKPAPGMFHHAANVFGDIDFSRSVMVGDMTTDGAAAAAANLPFILVETGFGGRDGKVADVVPTHTAPDLKAAVDWLLSAGPLAGLTPDGQ